MQKHDQARIRTLIGMLASGNTALNGPRDGVLRTGSDFDINALAVVYLATQQLLSEVAAAFDLLIEHFDDKANSYSYEAPAGHFSVRVGTACRRILTRVVECYDFEIKLITSDQHGIHVGNRSNEELGAWWKANRDRPLWKIQIEALDQAITFMENVSRETASSIHRRRQSCRPRNLKRGEGRTCAS